MSENICRFIPFYSGSHSIQAVNFVYETENNLSVSLKSYGLYRIHYVCGGKGELHLPGKIITLVEGDIFFTFPDTAFGIEEKNDFSYMYISCLGSRVSMIMDKLGINAQDFIIHGCHEVYDFWQKGFDVADIVTDWMTESILLYTFSYLGKRCFSKNHIVVDKTNISYEIKKVIDDNFSNENLSLKIIGEQLSYSPKYISAVFKKKFKVGISDYIATVRIQHACNLINQGFTSISDIASQCGYADSQYFSKVFRQKMGLSPRVYITESSLNAKQLSEG